MRASVARKLSWNRRHVALTNVDAVQFLVCEVYRIQKYKLQEALQSISVVRAGLRAQTRTFFKLVHSNGFNSPSMVGINSETVG